MTQDNQITSLNIEIRENLIGFREIGVFNDYTTNYNVNATEIKLCYDYIISNYQQMEKTFLKIFKAYQKQSFSPVTTILLGAYYLKYLEDNSVDIINNINELKKQKNNFIYVSNFLSVLKVSFYLVSNNFIIEFPKRNKHEKGLLPDIIVWKKKKKLSIDVKSRGVLQMQLLVERQVARINNPEFPNEWISIKQGAFNEVEKSKLKFQIAKGFKQADIVIIDESSNLTGIGGMFIVDELFHNPSIYPDKFKLKKNNLVFFALHGGKFKFIEMRLDKELKKIKSNNQPRII